MLHQLKKHFSEASYEELALAVALAPGSMLHNRNSGRRLKVIAKAKKVIKDLDQQGFRIAPKRRPIFEGENVTKEV